ncbi:ABC transporter substrate-binding protein [Candidatus Bathyarchaeota archaeon]|nr:ABC transporter substrate-binding protein [Candidatus Bathyarchaeota archaeon]
MYSKTRILLATIIILILAATGYFLYQRYIMPKASSVEFVFAYQDRVADLASIVAVKLRYFEDEGLNGVRAMMFHSGPACVEALVYGKADFGTMGDTTAILIAASKQPLKIIATHGGGENRHRIIARYGSGIRSIEDLVGKKIAVKKGTSTHGGLMLLAEKYGLDLDPYLIDLDPSSQLTALASGAVDAIVASEPTPSIAEYKKYGYEVATLGGLNNTYPILLVVRSEFAERHPEVVVKVLRALIRASRFIHEHPADAAGILANITGIPVEAVMKAMKYHYYNVTMDPRTVESLESMAKFLRDIGKIEETPDFRRVIDTSYLKEAYREIGS